MTPAQLVNLIYKMDISDDHKDDAARLVFKLVDDLYDAQITLQSITSAINNRRK